jgi:triacylglycerol esterase/lipase EstA (alpha/beta hydrolase family)
MNALGENRSTLQTNFQWSGSNLESKRQEAGKHLSNFVEDIHKVTGQRSETTLIGHSHGGNVIGHALTHQAAEGRGGVENAVMVGTPMMIDQQGTNVSWTAGGADKVQGQIISSHNNTDQVQTRAAHLNEFANGTTRNFQGSNPNAVVGSGREFHVPGSSTPQINISRRAQTISPVGAHEETHGVDSLREIAGRLPSRPSR